MIKEQKIKIKISNNGKYYERLGYGKLKQGDIILVPVQHLLPNSNKKVEYICDHCGKNDCRQYQLLTRSYNVDQLHLCYSCRRKFIGKYMNRINIDDATRRRIGNKHPRFNTKTKEYLRYAARVHSYTRCHFKCELKLLIGDKKIGRCGQDGCYQIDHVIPIKFGFDNNIDHKIIANISNVKIIPWKENRDKWYK